MVVSIWFWVAFNASILALLALDLGLIGRSAHVIRFREAAIRSLIWVAVALAFAFGLYWYAGSEPAVTFVTGYLIEESLSVDNIFVMVVIFWYFQIPQQHQHRVLFWGIIGALIMRGVFILVGTWLITHFHFVIYLFGGLLVVTAIRVAMRDEKAFAGDDNRLVRLIRRVVPVSRDFDGQRFLTIENGRRCATPLLMVLLLIEFMDLVFAMDSIPAVFSITRDPFLVYTSNVFAILGLRSMYFMVAAVMTRFRYLRYGLAFILAFVGVKMLLSDTVHIPTGAALLVVAAALATAIAASMLIKGNGTPAPGT